MASWDELPPTKEELKAVEPINTLPKVESKSLNTQPSSSPVEPQMSSNDDWSQQPPTPSELGEESSPVMDSDPIHKLLRTGYNFDEYYKLSKEDKRKYDQLSSHMGEVFQSGVKQGASGALTLGFKKDLFNNPEEAQSKIAELTPEEQELAKRNLSAGEFTGGAAANIPIALGTGGLVNAATKSISTVAQLGPLATRGVQAAGNIGAAGLMGEAQGIAQSDAPTLGERAVEALPTALLGAGTAGVLEGVAALAAPGAQAAGKSLASKLRGKAEIAAEKSLNPTAAEFLKLQQNPNNTVGKQLLDDGLGSNPLMSNESKANILSQAKNKAGQAIGGSTKELDSEINKLMQSAQTSPQRGQLIESILDKKKFVRELKQELLSPLEAAGDPNNVSFKIKELLSKLEQSGGPNSSLITLDDLNTFKQMAREGINYNTPGGAASANAVKDFTRKLNDKILQKSQMLDEIAGTNIADNLIKSNKEYGTLKTGEKAAQRAFAKEELKRDNLTPVAGAAGYALDGLSGGAAGVALGTAKKLTNTYGRNFQATSLNQLANLVKTAPQVLGKYSAPLQNASTRGSTALAAMHFTLYSKDPGYREKIDPLQEEAEKNSKNGNPSLDNSPNTDEPSAAGNYND